MTTAQGPASKIAVLRMINLAMCMSILTYGAVLFILGKIATVSLDFSDPYGQYVLLANVVVLVTLYIHKTQVAPEKDLQKRLGLSIVCLALNEFVAILGFAVVFAFSEDGNGFPFVANAVVAIVGNLMMFPKD